MKRLLTALAALLFLYGCKQSTPVSQVYVNLIDSNRSVKITGIDTIILNDIDRDSVKNWQSLFAVSRLPADADLKDDMPVQPGKYRVSKGSVIFTPDTPFAKQQLYFVRYYNYVGNKSVWDYVRGRTKPGQLHYTDLIFKP
jgi:hypothetical protein